MRHYAFMILIPDDHGYISRSFTRRYILPDDVKVEHVECNLSTDGVLTLKAPRITVIKDENARRIPIIATGQPAMKMQSKSSSSSAYSASTSSSSTETKSAAAASGGATATKWRKRRNGTIARRTGEHFDDIHQRCFCSSASSTSTWTTWSLKSNAFSIHYSNIEILSHA